MIDRVDCSGTGLGHSSSVYRESATGEEDSVTILTRDQTGFDQLDPINSSGCTVGKAIAEGVIAHSYTRHYSVPVGKLTERQCQMNKSRFDPAQVQKMWEQRFFQEGYPYSMNSRIGSGFFSTGVGSGKVYFAFSSDGDIKGFSLDANGACLPLELSQLPEKPAMVTDPSNDYYFCSGPRIRTEKNDQLTNSQPQNRLEFLSNELKKSQSAVTANDEMIALLADELRNPQKSIAFYTAAGISIAAGIDDLNGYHRRIFGQTGEPKTDEDFQTMSKRILEEPATVLRSIKEFFESFYFTDPTLTHKAIADLSICLSKPIPIFTENGDLLHQKTGVEALVMKAPVHPMKAKLGRQWIENLDYLVCTGLSHDDRGFIAYLREINPNLRIVANSLPGEIPLFIFQNEPKDIYLPGDAHKIFPKLRDLCVSSS